MLSLHQLAPNGKFKLGNISHHAGNADFKVVTVNNTLPPEVAVILNW